MLTLKTDDNDDRMKLFDKLPLKSILVEYLAQSHDLET